MLKLPEIKNYKKVDFFKNISIEPIRDNNNESELNHI
jgi:hypothetical protein